VKHVLLISVEDSQDQPSALCDAAPAETKLDTEQPGQYQGARSDASRENQVARIIGS
jgi:hypothetical protein